MRCVRQESRLGHAGLCFRTRARSGTSRSRRSPSAPSSSVPIGVPWRNTSLRRLRCRHGSATSATGSARLRIDGGSPRRGPNCLSYGGQICRSFANAVGCASRRWKFVVVMTAYCIEFREQVHAIASHPVMYSSRRSPPRLSADATAASTVRASHLIRFLHPTRQIRDRRYVNVMTAGEGHRGRRRRAASTCAVTIDARPGGPLPGSCNRRGRRCTFRAERIETLRPAPCRGGIACSPAADRSPGRETP
jgi:hypothetical protein